VRANDGVVPTASWVWGTIAWAGAADHLDVFGHHRSAATGHVDWLSSGAGFDDGAFARLMDSIADGMLAAARERRPAAA
jgi:hypothetical protein